LDPRGAAYLEPIFAEISMALGAKTPALAIEMLEQLLTEWEMKNPAMTEEEIGVLIASVNTVRLKNHPIALDEKTIAELYTIIGKTNK
jgi:hypothetical protein